MPTMTKDDYLVRATELLEASREGLNAEGFSYRGELPIGETWAWTLSHNRDSDQLTESNWDTIISDMRKRFPKDTVIESFSHWAVGWTESLAVRMLDKKGNVTKAGKAIIDWKEKLESYPVADEEDLSRREYEQSIENISSEGRISDEEAALVYTKGWHDFGDEFQRAQTDDGSFYPDYKLIIKILDSLGDERWKLLRGLNQAKNDKGEFRVDQATLVRNVIMRRHSGNVCTISVMTGNESAGWQDLVTDDEIPCDIDFDINALVGLTEDQATEYMNYVVRTQ